MFGIAIETLDLLRACPIWRKQASDTPFLQRILSLREHWSYRTLLISAPLGRREILAGADDVGSDLHSSIQLLSYWRCRTEVLWRVIGPGALLADLRGNNGGEALPWSRSDEDCAAAAPLALFLCQHEIRGD